MRQITDPVIAGLLEAAPDATVCVDSDGRIVLVNAQAERLFGYPREELAGQLVEILVPDALKTAHRGLRAGYAADPQRRPMGAGLELSGRHRDGTTFPAEVALSAFDTGQGILVSAAIRNVTEQRQAAQAQAWLASIIESAHDAVISMDLDGRIMTWTQEPSDSTATPPPRSSAVIAMSCSPPSTAPRCTKGTPPWPGVRRRRNIRPTGSARTGP